MEKNDKIIGRFRPSSKNGLTLEQVEGRKKDKLTNKTKITVGKSISEIIFSNLFSFFNILLFIIAGLLIYAQQYSSMFFLAVLIPNICIGLIQDLHARHLMKKLRLMTAPKATVVRGGEEYVINTEDVVLDDIVILKSGDQVPADGIILTGNLAVNESLLTGESDNVYKNPGDNVLAGSYIASGKGYVQMIKVGNDTYVESIKNQANKFKRSPSQILKALRNMFKVIGAIVIVLGVCLVVSYYFQGKFNGMSEIQSSIGSIAGSMVSMIPSGLFLLTSVSLATGVITLAKKRTAVQELYSIEMLARVDVLCVDKTGTITDGSMKVNQVVPLANLAEDQLKQIISNVLINVKDDNDTARALREYFDFDLTCEAVKTLPFNSENKYSGATLRGKGTYIIGALDFLNLANKKGVEFKVKDYTSRGYRVLVVGYSALTIASNSFKELLTPVALIVLKDNVRPDAVETFKWFGENGVEIKVISGDDPVTVSQIAKEAGINNADNYVSLVGKTIEEVKELATQYTVFGRVTPEQKEALVIALKKKKHTVAMTGDGVNDILALKRADCSIAMASGSAAARNVSHIVLMDNNFDRLPHVVAEGRRVINNIQRTSSLFLVKTTFAMLLTLFFFIMSWVDKSYSYPFLTNHMYMWEILAIGLSAFFIALQKNDEQVKGNFLKNIFKNAIPAGITSVLLVLSIYLYRYLDQQNIWYLGFSSDVVVSTQQIIAMAVPSFSIFAFVVLFKVCLPLNKYRLIVFSCALLAFFGVLGFDIYTAVVLQQPNILNIPWNSLTTENIFLGSISLLIITTLYLFITFVVKAVKGGKKHD